MKKYIIITLFIFFVYTSSISSSLTDKDFIYPTEYIEISSYYGNRILYSKNNFHNGIDFLAPLNSPIYASASGYIEYASFLESGYGNTVIISHNEEFKTLYCHISEIFVVNVGDYVKQGEIIGYVGPKYLSDGTMNGNTTGPHLHFTVIKNNNTINPFEVLKK